MFAPQTQAPVPGWPSSTAASGKPDRAADPCRVTLEGNQSLSACLRQVRSGFALRDRSRQRRQVVELPRLAAATGKNCVHALGGTYIMFIGPRIQWTGR